MRKTEKEPWEGLAGNTQGQDALIDRAHTGKARGMALPEFTGVRGEERERRRRYAGWYPSGRDDPL